MLALEVPAAAARSMPAVQGSSDLEHTHSVMPAEGTESESLGCGIAAWEMAVDSQHCSLADVLCFPRIGGSDLELSRKRLLLACERTGDKSQC